MWMNIDVSLMYVPSTTGGGTLPMAILQHCAPQVSVDLVELHGAVMRAATGYFGVPKDEPRIKLFLEDGSVL